LRREDEGRWRREASRQNSAGIEKTVISWKTSCVERMELCERIEGSTDKTALQRNPRMKHKYRSVIKV